MVLGKEDDWMSRLISIFVIKHSQAIALLHITKTTVLLAKPTIGAYMDCAIASINVTCLVKPNIISTFLGPLSLGGPLRSEGTEGGRYASECSVCHLAGTGSLGVPLEDDLRVTEHVRELRYHGFPITRALQQVARATTVAKLTYASPAWWGVTHRQLSAISLKGSC